MSYDPASGTPGWQQQPPGYPPPGAGFGQQQPGWGPPPPGPGPGGPGTTAPKSTIAAMFDLSFSTFATPGLIKLLYVLGMVLLVVGWLGLTVAAFAANGAGSGILVLLGGAFVVLFYLAFLRLILEFYFAVVRMSEDIHRRP